jgi:AraC family transcriptional activator of pobA
LEKFKEIKKMNTISIEKFNQEGFEAAYCYQNDVFIANHIESVDQFRFPCRIDAVAILVCIEGEICCNINLKEYRVKANGILVNLPENIIQIESVSDFDAYIVLISTSYLKELQIDLKQKLDSYFKLRDQPLNYVRFEDISPMKYYYYLLKDNILEPKLDVTDIIRGLVTSLIFTVVSVINANQKRDSGNDIPNKTSMQISFDKFMSLLALYHTKERSVKFYAGKLSLTPNYLSGIVKEYSGKTAAEWIIEYVILEAKSLLRFSGLNIQQIAYQLNFPSQSSFGKYFKNQTGVSPKTYVKGNCEPHKSRHLGLSQGR